MKNKEFDCVEMKRRGAARIYEQIKDMSFEEKVQYWKKRSDEAIARQNERVQILNEEVAGCAQQKRCD